jgi:hypothetical protein
VPQHGEPHEARPTSKSAAASAREGPPVSASVSASALAEVLAEALAEPPLTVTVSTMPISSCGPQKYS